MTLAVLIIQRDALLCEGLKVVLSMAVEKHETVSLPSFEEGMCAAMGGGFDLILADISLAPNGAREAARALKVASPNSRIIMLASNIAEIELLESLAAGAHGFLLKDASLEETALAIRDVVSGRIYVPNEIHVPPAPDAAQFLSSTPEYSRLTPRQMQVARELARGARTKQIARDLNLSEGTVKLHLGAIFRVLRCNSRAEAAAVLARYPLAG